MSDQIDALERLAKLREQGCLTDEEFKAEKAKLLNGGGKPTRKSLAEAWEETADQRRSMWGNLKWQLGALFVLAPVLGYAGWTQLHKMTPEQATKIIGERLPQCASEDVRKALRGAIEGSPASKLVAIEVVEIAHIEERGVGGEPIKRYCAADVSTNGGTEHIGFTLRHSDEDDGFIIETGEDMGPPAPASETTPASSPSAIRVGSSGEIGDHDVAPSTGKIHNLVIDENLLKYANRSDGEALQFCTGDQFLIRNDSSRPVHLMVGSEDSDDSFDEGVLNPGGSMKGSAKDTGLTLVTGTTDQSPQDLELFRYNVRACQAGERST